MAIYAIGSHYEGTRDVSDDFIKGNFVGIGWPNSYAPELHQFIASLKVGDIIYIKSVAANSKFIFVRAIGFIKDDTILKNKLVKSGRNVFWKVTEKFQIQKPKEKNNVRLNSIYQEFHPEVQAQILKQLV